ncbi:MAG: DUF1638 domain-containing protein [Desulfamplus sp.]|nr:DUF1638 domain-containing protein [Desulfamplus sp.]
MEKLNNVHFIGCGVLAPDVKEIADRLKIEIKMTFLPGGLHDKPNELRLRLQSAIDEAAKDKSSSRIVVGYGICGRGTVGINAPYVPLIFPKVHDCIAMFMGSDEAYKREFAKYPGTFYLSAGWCIEKWRAEDRVKEGKQEQKIWIGSESMGCSELKKRYGEKGGGKIIDFFSSWQKNYQRAAFIDTGASNGERYEKQAQNMAKEYGWIYEKIEGDSSLMVKMLTQDYSDDAILVVPPHHTTIYSAFKNSLDSAPIVSSKFEKEEGRGADFQIENGKKSTGIKEEPKEVGAAKKEGRGLLIRYGLGIDAGGTYTDAVIYDFHDKKIIHKNKALTTKWDFSIGIDNALSKLDQDMLSKVELVSISTTLATNAIVEGEGQKTGLILMKSPGMVSDDLIEHTPKRNIKGSINISGEEVEPVDEAEVRAVVREMMKNDQVTAFAVSGFAGAINPAHELIVKKIVEEESKMVACCGHELSDLLNFVVRAQTALLNARIIPRMVKFFREIDHVLKQRGVFAPVMVVKGDGTLISSEMAKERPVETILSGPAASVAGAKLLTGLSNAMVVDMGGTTTDTADICENIVAVCQSGARVGGFATHVKALDMRTVGLGGDSLIRWVKGDFAIGPRRVAPLVLAANLDPSGFNQALFHMEQRNIPHLEQVIFVAMDRGELPFSPTAQELQIYELLLNRPHTPEELAEALKSLSTLFLPMERLEESGVVQRCGLTPTDLLHVRGDFKKWSPEPAKKVLKIMASFKNISVEELIDALLSRVERQLAIELLKNLIFKDIENSHDAIENELEQSILAKHLMANILDPARSSRYRIRAEFCHPVIGIGAPIHYFLPKVGKLLNAEVIVPQDADVANAIGAITSHIMIKQRLVIRPDSFGRFVVEGVAGNISFKEVEEAQSWSVDYLKDSVINQAVKAGTSSKSVSINIDDRIVNTGNGLSLFLDKTITATLNGTPDLVLKHG